MQVKRITALGIVVAFVSSVGLAQTTMPTVAESIDVAPVWSGHPVGFALLTHRDRQYIAYYDADRRMTVASRTLDSTVWNRQTLPETVGWDSHNYVTMAVDAQGHLHVSGNMHNVPIVYFRTTTPGDVTTLARVTSLVGREEKRCTYPAFFTGPKGEFIFTYRDGGSGNGNQIYNRYDADTEQWSRLLDKPLLDGEGERNAYVSRPTRGPDGFWHIVWVWRDTPDAATNHDVSYARSRDLVHWERSDGTPLSLPITVAPARSSTPCRQAAG